MTSNYSNITKQNGTLTVNKVSVTVTADSKTKVYGEDNPELTYTESDFVNEETLESLGIVPELSTTAMKTSIAGDYPITFVEPTTSTTNYEITYVPGILTITANEKEIVVRRDASRDYNGQALTQPDYEMISGQLASGDYIDKVTMTADSTITNAGTQTNVIESIVIRNEAGEDVTGNYSNITKQNGTLTVNKVSVTVTADTRRRNMGKRTPS